MDAEEARHRLRRARSAATGGEWRADAPAPPLHDRQGAEIVRTPTPSGPHLRNGFDGELFGAT